MYPHVAKGVAPFATELEACCMSLGRQMLRMEFGQTSSVSTQWWQLARRSGAFLILNQMTSKRGDAFGSLGSHILRPFLRRSARALTFKAVRGTVAIEGIFDIRFPSFPLTGGGGPFPLWGHRFPLRGPPLIFRLSI